MSPGNKAIDMMLEAYKDANNLYEQSQEAESNLDINYDPTLYDCPDCYDDRNWEGKNPNCNHIPVQSISASQREKIEKQKLMHTRGYRDNALAIKAETAKPIIWHRRWRQILQAKPGIQKLVSDIKYYLMPSIEIIKMHVVFILVIMVGYIIG